MRKSPWMKRAAREQDAEELRGYRTEVAGAADICGRCGKRRDDHVFAVECDERGNTFLEAQVAA